MTSLQTSTNVLSTANVLVTTIKALEKITYSYKNKTKKRGLHVAPLKETLSKLMIFFSSKTLALENILTVFFALQFNMAITFLFKKNLHGILYIPLEKRKKMIGSLQKCS